ncbi:MAG: type I methionyl aminopeptidase [Armatimonadetes bacterium]|nr:type I methionyl aminopeptidase [Armatimonadota bacterium]
MGQKIRIKSTEDLAVMRENGILVARALRHLASLVRPGVTTMDLDREGEQFLRDHGATPSFLGYGGYPASVCAAHNEVVVHGIPNRVPLKEGDIIGIDIGAFRNGLHADSAITVPVGDISPATRELLTVTEESLWQGIAKARAGNHVGDISHAIQSYVEERGYSVVQELVGHGVGFNLHEDPQVPNFGEPGDGVRLRPGMTLAIEPMINQGTREVQVLPDKWTIVTLDGRFSAHFEHTVAITDGEPKIITLLPPDD